VKTAANIESFARLNPENPSLKTYRNCMSYLLTLK